MKNYIILFVMILSAVFSSCAGQSAQTEEISELEALKAEYAKFDPYLDLIDALEAKDYALAEDILNGYRASDYNQQVNTGKIEEIQITNDNWAEYFETVKITEWTENELGDTTGFITHVFIVPVESYIEQIDISASNVAFAWSALCSVKNCDVDLENRMIAYENVFQSTTTTFGDPERLSGTVSFDPQSINRKNWNEYNAVAEIGEIVIVGEYLRGTEMKSVCFDYDEVTVSQAEGVLVLKNTGE